MRHKSLIQATILALPLAGPAMAQETDIRSVRAEIASMRQDYEARILRLEKRLAQAEAASSRAATTAAHAQSTVGVGTPQASGRPGQRAVTQRAVTQRTVTARTDPPAGAPESAAETPSSATPAASPAPPASGNSFNPKMAVVLNGTVGASRRDPAAYRMPGFSIGPEVRPVDRGFALGESEIFLSANIDQALYGAVFLSYARDNTVSLEEAFIQTTSLPGGFTVKGGRFKSGIGYMNEQHAHTWDFADAPLPYRAMLNNQYADDGAQVRWLAPTAMFVEIGAEAFRGDALPASGAANKGFGAFAAFAHIGDDIGAGGEGGSWRIGVSELWTKAANRVTGADSFNGDDRLTIVDAIYKWAPGGNFADRYVKLQGEYFHRLERGVFNGQGLAATQQGFYVQAIWQFAPRWRAGARYDRVWGGSANPGLAGGALDPGGRVGARESIMLDYSTSEYGRFRLQANLDQSSGKYDPQILLQYTVSLGAHGAHNY